MEKIFTIEIVTTVKVDTKASSIEEALKKVKARHDELYEFDNHYVTVEFRQKETL